jgi:predicted Zn-ribbon and HTH transcriptional regulator
MKETTQDKDVSRILFNQKTDNMSIITECPNCGDRHNRGVPYAKVPCHNCGASYRTTFSQDIYTKKAKEIMQACAWNNKIIISANENYLPSLINLKEDFIRFRNWEVSDITKSSETIAVCSRCGVCQSCFVCKNCGKSFEKNPNRRKPVCPHCKSEKVIKTYFTECITPEKDRRIHLCPHCKSDSIKLTIVVDSDECPKCKSKELIGKKVQNIYTLEIERKRAYRKENFE